MQTMPTIIERACQLAASEKYLSVAAIKRRLANEGYTNVEAHLAGASILATLRRIRASVRAASGAAST
jgi:hypothetical protein